MIGSGDKVVWGDAGETVRYGTIVSKRVGNSGTLLEGLDRHGAVFAVKARDRHKTISVTANVLESVNEENIPQVGDIFVVPINGVMTAFVCRSADLQSYPEDISQLTITGRTCKGVTLPPFIEELRDRELNQELHKEQN